MPLLLGCDTTGKVKKKEFALRACREMAAEGYQMIQPPVYCPGHTLKKVIQDMTTIIMSGADVSRALLLCMLNKCDNWSAWFSRRRDAWTRISSFTQLLRDRNITFSCILKNGNIVFSTRSKLFLSTDSLKTYEQITVKNVDGSDYLPHTPADADNPGWYFHTIPGINSWDVNGSEMLVWGNYCNVVGGPSPVNIYYSIDSGRTVKIAYAFGRNPHVGPDAAGTPLGNPDNPVFCRHLH